MNSTLITLIGYPIIVVIAIIIFTAVTAHAENHHDKR